MKCSYPTSIPQENGLKNISLGANDLIFKRVNQEYPEKIDIPKEDEIGIMIYLNREITRLQQSKNPKIKNYVEKIKYELMGGTEAIHNSEIWKVLSYAQRERFEEKEENPSKSKSLIYVKAKNNSVVNAKNRSIFSIFRKEPQIPLTERDLAKISIDWLAKYIPKDMLQELEADRNKEENNVRDKEYLPDPKAPIYEMIKSVTRFGIPNRKSGRPHFLCQKSGHPRRQRCHPQPCRGNTDKICRTAQAPRHQYDDGQGRHSFR